MMSTPDQKSSTSQSTNAAMLFMQHYGFVRAMAVRHAPWPGLIDDVFQQVFLEFMQDAVRRDLERDLRPLLATMTRRIALRHWKQTMRGQSESFQRLAEHIRQVAEGREDAPQWEDEFDAMRQCLQRLPHESRTLLDLYYFQEISTDTIGQRLSMKADTVRRAISRLREKLRECVQLNLKPDPHHA